MLLAMVMVIFWGGVAHAWSGYDQERGADVEIDKGNLVRPGETIEIYDYSDGQYKDVDVEDVRATRYGVEVEVYDGDAGEYRVLEMED